MVNYRAPSLELSGVGKTYYPRDGAQVVAVEGVDLSIQSGEFVSLVGPSGCGKTTILNIIIGLLNQTVGEVSLEFGDDERQYPGVVFQQPILLPWRTALENVALPAEVGQGGRARSSWLSGLVGRAKPTDKSSDVVARARDLLSMVGLHGFEEKYPAELSGGMQQRVAIARALLNRNQVLCLDEPFSALDEFTREQMNEQLLEIWHEQSLTCVFVTHNLFEAVFLSDRVVVMGTGPGHVITELEVPLPDRGAERC